MKKVILLGLVVMMMAGTSIATAAASTFRVLVNGYVVTSDTLTESNTTLVPFKVIFQELEYSIAYTAATKTIKADKNDTSITLTVGSTKAIVNGKETVMPVAPKVVKGVTYVPLRFVATVSGEEIALDSGRKAIQIGKQIDWALLDKPTLRSATWGMSMDQVKKSESSKLIEDNKKSQYLTYQSQITGFEAMSFYSFQDKRLSEGAYFVSLSAANSHVKDFKTLVAYLTKQYGEPIVDIMRDQQDKDGNLYSDEIWNQVVMSPEGGLVAEWKTADTEIMLAVAMNLQEISDIQITYTSWLSPNYGRLSKYIK